MQAPLPEIAAIVREMVRDPAIEIGECTRFEDVLDGDSLNLIAAAVEVECRLGVMFDVPEIGQIVTLGDLAALVDRKRAMVAV
jgi:acyl carrier protein